jgi:hypothetical protein
MSQAVAPCTCQELLSRHPQIWQAAMRVSAVSPEVLYQEWYRAADLIRLACRVLDAAPAQDLPVLMTGLTALKDEYLKWQTRCQALEPQINLAPATSEPLNQLLTAPYPDQATLLWALALAQYQRSQAFPDPSPQPFLDPLAALADQALAQTSPEVCQQVEACFLAAFCP